MNHGFIHTYNNLGCRCERCTRVHAEYAAERRNRKKGLTYHTPSNSQPVTLPTRKIKDFISRSYNKWKRARAAGLCGTCYKTQPDFGMKHCQVCLARIRDRRQQKKVATVPLPVEKMKQYEWDRT